MKITQLLQEDKVTLSLEVFPPKKDTAVEQVSRSVREIAALQPDFMSVTYGAGGGTSAYTPYLFDHAYGESVPVKSSQCFFNCVYFCAFLYAVTAFCTLLVYLSGSNR